MLETRHPELEVRGVPPLSFRGCKQPTVTHRRLQELRRTGDPLDEGISELLRRQPTCLAGSVAGAELCLRRKDFRCALGYARRVLEYDKSQPHALVVRTMVRRHQQGKWTHRMWQHLNVVRQQYPAYLRARRIHALSFAATSLNFCYLHADLEDVLVQSPDCTWARRALKITSQALGPSIKEEFKSRQQTYLAAITRTVRRHGATLLLLNYPPSQINPCQAAITSSIARFSDTFSVPRVELRGAGASARPHNAGQTP